MTRGYEPRDKRVIETTARLIKFHRNQKGWSIAGLARNSGVGESTIAHLELGEGSPRVTTILRLAEAMEIHPSQLIPPRAV